MKIGSIIDQTLDVPEGSEYCIDKAGKITGIGEIISDEGEARAKGRIGCMRSAIAGGLAAVFEGRSHMHRTLQLPWRTPRKRTKLPSAECANNAVSQGRYPVP